MATRKKKVVDEDYSKLDQYAIELHEFYKSLRKAGGAPTNVPTPQVNMQPQSPISSVPTVNAFAPGSGLQGTPLSDGAEFGPGRDSSAQPQPASAPNPDSIFVRAMAAANPESRQLMMMVEAYNEMEAN